MSPVRGPCLVDAQAARTVARLLSHTECGPTVAGRTTFRRSHPSIRATLSASGSLRPESSGSARSGSGELACPREQRRLGGSLALPCRLAPALVRDEGRVDPVQHLGQSGLVRRDRLPASGGGPPRAARIARAP